ncbi:MAG TPA: histidine kinase, partial [Puia sp.]|nr:histidine kinase [Puia sp.]
RVNNLETEKLKLELSQLKAQLQPHFFFNTVNNMYALSVQHSPQTPKMIKDLSGVMRYILYDARNERVFLHQEIDFIKSYISLENMRHGKENIIDLVVQGKTDNIRVEPLLFLPFVENTFKHALHADIPEKWVKLVLTVDDDELVFQATNPRVPVSMQPDTNRGGIGLSNIRKRLELLFPQRHELAIHDEANTFTVILTINLKHD